ncbi:hypothetical protein EDI_034050 [Entamoeba dispar SAW760]|uniref:Uncharacterized protein n=1 Tax=Entamoeba dispar (strain ATCC PRA-260 / SAW760) TaxID=370354 RepID=B0EFS8_ENTDS|nr:uncharacterized protein EDI_034050 [Entamoeba dispar SAW760]EDR26624.1 hypothetical protein EDI_034050 [Entamoeba dispar SAW760]|eukprot:EDR26624.1 hypothetical protein EDI_034050 [Entamoeba dispar SAW760]
MQLEQLFLKIVFKYLPIKEIKCVTIINHKCTQIIEQTLELYNVDDYKFVANHFTQIKMLYIPFHQIFNFPYDLFNEKLLISFTCPTLSGFHYKQSKTKEKNLITNHSSQIIQLIITNHQLVLSLTHFTNLKKLIIFSQQIQVKDISLISSAVQTIPSIELVVIKNLENVGVMKFHNFVNLNPYKPMNSVKFSNELILSLKEMCKKCRVVIEIDTINNVKEFCNAYQLLLNEKNFICFVHKYIELTQDPIPSNILIDFSPFKVYVDELSNSSLNTIKSFIKNGSITSLALKTLYQLPNPINQFNPFYNQPNAIAMYDYLIPQVLPMVNAPQIHTQIPHIIDLSDCDSLSSINIEFRFSKLTKINVPSSLTHISISSLDYVVSNIFEQPLIYLSILHSLFYSTVKLPLTLETIELTNCKSLEQLDLSQHNNLKFLSLHNIPLLSKIIIPQRLHSFVLSNVSSQLKSKFEIDGLKESQIKKCKLERMSNLFNIEMPESLFELSVTSCINLNITNLFDLSLPRKTMLLLKEYSN